MFEILQILTTVWVAIAMAPVLAHALEYPGKMRLSRDAYLTVQPIYYPGFGGVDRFADLHPTGSRASRSALSVRASSLSAPRTDQQRENNAADWKRLRDRWEYSHIVRAGLVFLSFLFLLLAIVYE